MSTPFHETTTDLESISVKFGSRSIVESNCGLPSSFLPLIVRWISSSLVTFFVRKFSSSGEWITLPYYNIIEAHQPAWRLTYLSIFLCIFWALIPFARMTMVLKCDVLVCRDSILWSLGESNPLNEFNEIVTIGISETKSKQLDNLSS